MKKYIFTFGCGQELAGFCQPIIAESHKAARDKMFELHGDRWGFQYSEENWEECKQSAKENGYPIERELTPICLAEGEME